MASIKQWIKPSLFLLLWGAYFSCGLALARTNALSEMDLVFNADCPRVVSDLTLVDGNHYRTKVHPIFVLLFNPLGVLVAQIAASPLISALLLTSFAGALCIILAYYFFEAAGLRPVQGFLCTAVLAASTTHILFASAPETFIFAACSLILLYLLAMHHPRSLKHFIPAGVLALGIVTTNFVQALIVFSFCAYKGILDRPLLKRLATFAAQVLGCTAALSIAQWLAYPTSVPFFLPEAYAEDLRFLVPLQQSGVAASRAGSLMRHIFLFNFVAPRPHVWRTPTRFAPMVSFDTSSATLSDGLGLAANALWMFLLAWTVYTLIHFRNKQPRLLIPIGTCLLFNFALHMVYGDDLMVYSADWTYLVLLGLALILKGWDRSGGRLPLLRDGLLLSFFIVELLNNGRFFGHLLVVYR